MIDMSPVSFLCLLISAISFSWFGMIGHLMSMILEGIWTTDKAPDIGDYGESHNSSYRVLAIMNKWVNKQMALLCNFGQDRQ
jgi:hypothetical protein